MDGHSLEILTHESNSITLQPLKKRVTDISIQVDLSAIGDNKVAPWYALIKSRVECEQYLKYITIPSLLLPLTKLCYFWEHYKKFFIPRDFAHAGMAVLKTFHIFFIVPCRLLPASNFLIFFFKWKHTGQIALWLNFCWKFKRTTVLWHLGAFAWKTAQWCKCRLHSICKI